MRKGHEAEKRQPNKPNIVFRVGQKIDDIKKVLGYEPQYNENVVQLKGSDVNDLETGGFIDKDNFRLQIGKMQEDGETIYSPYVLKPGLEYIANHMKLDEEGNGKAIIQLWPELAECLLQEKKDILSFEQEKKEIKKLIKELLGKKRKNIEIQNVADNYPDVFSAIKNGREGIIPDKEPLLENFIVPLESPLPIIKFLAYHAKNDPNLMNVFYETKPIKYKKQDEDKDKNYTPGSSDADYYSIVEVGIRLFEVLKGIYIQGGIGRQRVYDKIISLIIFGKDKIGKAKDYGANTVLKLNDYPALRNLHNRLVNSGVCNNIKMNQLYIEINGGDKIKDKIKDKKNLSSKIINGAIILALSNALTFSLGYLINQKVQDNKKRKDYDERSDSWDRYNRNTRGLDDVDYLTIGDYVCSYESLQEDILAVKYDLSAYDYIDNLDSFGYTHHFNEETLEWEEKRHHVSTSKVKRNKIIDEFHDYFWFYYNATHGLKWLTAEEFIEYNGGSLIDNHNFTFQNAYEHRKVSEMNAIINTINYGKDIDISKCDVREVKGKEQLKYYIDSEGDRGFYRLKFVNVLIDGEYKELIMAAKYNRFSQKIEEDFTLENGFNCMQDLAQKYLK